ncbi:hypothetical protein CLAFUW4_04247 [Fulvia fulva]|uniref:Uncharacterized protein n=1 Tax=Passalora fulva TaxID=5499 RepID=A0A9Q8LEB7_PASFU|nr:uncharacterized protein CLAFUR5_04213 [Fulvia fulva]KAK4626211.1 hypothetical protein CLAFUR4_04233 [Fulvia fulva]KAK4627543.1 hypothetical protein CLAFUR0_04235 [Fulvia fulva]UJO15843.1 hypothetical protein CLAFUR5_04213 [Fulvia fulva]WPV13882.1 hypothetical protein CLAFUW4_04247 [Fulvia fulva]WPV28982.1 hypothetical protein CLAFUW7_04236 [Fulvia fulva]
MVNRKSTNLQAPEATGSTSGSRKTPANNRGTSALRGSQAELKDMLPDERDMEEDRQKRIRTAEKETAKYGPTPEDRRANQHKYIDDKKTGQIAEKPDISKRNESKIDKENKKNLDKGDLVEIIRGHLNLQADERSDKYIHHELYRPRETLWYNVDPLHQFLTHELHKFVELFELLPGDPLLAIGFLYRAIQKRNFNHSIQVIIDSGDISRYINFKDIETALTDVNKAADSIRGEVRGEVEKMRGTSRLLNKSTMATNNMNFALAEMEGVHHSGKIFSQARSTNAMQDPEDAEDPGDHEISQPGDSDDSSDDDGPRATLSRGDKKVKKARIAKKPVKQSKKTAISMEAVKIVAGQPERKAVGETYNNGLVDIRNGLYLPPNPPKVNGPLGGNSTMSGASDPALNSETGTTAGKGITISKIKGALTASILAQRGNETVTGGPKAKDSEAQTAKTGKLKAGSAKANGVGANTAESSSTPPNGLKNILLIRPKVLPGKKIR